MTDPNHEENFEDDTTLEDLRGPAGQTEWVDPDVLPAGVRDPDDVPVEPGPEEDEPVE